MAAVLLVGSVFGTGLAILPNSVQDAHAGQCNDNTIGLPSNLGESGQGDGEQDDSGVAEIDCDVTGLLIINEITVIESEEVDPEFE